MKRVLCVGLLALSTAQAVELGSVSLTSVVGEPLRAQIPILLEKGESMEHLSAAILETKPEISGLELVLAESPSPHIQLSSKQPMTLPKFALVLQVSEPQEDNEYRYELALPAADKSAAKQVKPLVYGPVKAGDTLWQVASRFAKHYDLTPDQAMAALYEHNRKAFVKGNENQLMAGSYLKLPVNITKTLTVAHHSPVHFKPMEVVSKPLAPTPKSLSTESGPTSEALLAQVPSTSSTIPEFPEMSEGKQVAMNISNAVPDVSSLKLINPLTDADAALFSNALNTVLSAEDKVDTTLIEQLQKELGTAREAIDVEHQAKMALQNQLNDLEVQIRALTELVSLQQSRDVGAGVQEANTTGPWVRSLGNAQWVWLCVAIGIASVLMYIWERSRAPKQALAIPSSKKAVKRTPTQASLAEADRYIAQGRYLQAQEMLSKILSTQPGDFDALFKLCQVYTKSDNRSAFEAKLNQFSPRWRAQYPGRFERLQALYQGAWSAASVPHEGGAPLYDGDPPSDPVQTKLDLARAYIDIGDQSSAHEILLEVLKEGTPAQILSAQLLISQIKQ